MRCVAVIFLLSAICAAEQAQKPACNKANQGKLWPAEANVNTELARQSYQEGALEMCTLSVWKYRWERLSVNVHNLSKTKPRTGAAMSAPPARPRPGA